MLKRKQFSSLSDVKGTVIVRKQGGHRLKLLTHLPNNIFFENNLERIQDSQNAYFSALTIQISSTSWLLAFYSFGYFLSLHSCVWVLDCIRNEKHVQQYSFMCAAHICEIVSAGVFAECSICSICTYVRF